MQFQSKLTDILYAIESSYLYQVYFPGSMLCSHSLQVAIQNGTDKPISPSLNLNMTGEYIHVPNNYKLSIQNSKIDRWLLNLIRHSTSQQQERCVISRSAPQLVQVYTQLEERKNQLFAILCYTGRIIC
jgi:hypothetical protein